MNRSVSACDTARVLTPDAPHASIVPAALADAERIARLHIASWQATYASELSAGFLASQDVAGRTAHWAAMLQAGTSVWLAAEGGCLLGFVACGPTRDADAVGSPLPWEIYNLHVSPASHGRGHGRALFEHAVQLGRAARALETRLWVVESNARARAFYERQGMRWDGARQAHAVSPGEVLEEVRYWMASTATCRDR